MAQIREILYRTLKGDSARYLAKSLGVSRTSISKYLGIAREHFGFNEKSNIHQIDDLALKISDFVYSTEAKTNKTDLLLIPYKDFIKKLLSDKHITHTQIQRKLRSLHGCEVHIRTLNRFINKHLSPPIAYTIHMPTKPGEEAQVDYADVGMMAGSDGKVRKTYIFVMTLSHSRHRYVEFVQSQNQRSWCQSHINAFQFFGCVPKRILLDNLKAGVVKPNIYDPTLNQAYQELSHFYNFIADPAKVRTPQHKGKVERSVTIVKQQLIAGCSYVDTTVANKAAQHWCKHEIAHRTCTSTGRSPHDLFHQEDKPAMLDLPEKLFDLPDWTQGLVHKDHHIIIDKNFYSVPTKYIGETVSIRVGLRTIEVYHQHRLVKAHIRSMDKGQWITDKSDYPDSVHYFLSQDKGYCLAKADEIGDSVSHLISKLLERDSKTLLRKAQAILRLIDDYGAKRLNDACLRASVYDSYELEAIKTILRKGLDKQTSRSCAIHVIDSSRTAYIRPANEYSSDMEVNYG